MEVDRGFNGVFKVLNGVEEALLALLMLRLVANLKGNVRITRELAREEAIKT